MILIRDSETESVREREGGRMCVIQLLAPSVIIAVGDVLSVNPISICFSFN